MNSSIVCQPPRKFRTLLELSAPLDWLSVPFRLPSLATAPKGDQRPVMLIPGYMTDELSMRPLKIFLNHKGYNAHDWLLGRNLGNVDLDIERAAQPLANYVVEYKQPVTLIGWSLGGVIARELARLFPELVREVITLGTPITGGPKYTFVGQTYAKTKGLDLDKFELHVLERNKIGFKQPVTSIFSKQDGIVGWQASVDVYNPQARNIEVHSTHFGIGINGRVWRIIAETLAAS